MPDILAAASGGVASPDDLLLVLLADTDDLDLRLLAVKELLRHSSDAEDFHDYSEEIGVTLGILINSLAALISADEERGRAVIGHVLLPQLVKLLVRKWPWPVVSDKAAGGSFGTFVNDVSRLKMFGYTVGKEGWSAEKRRAFLTDLIELELPQAVRAKVGGEYGDPCTAQRLRKVATVISANCGNFLRNDRERYAVACRGLAG